MAADPEKIVELATTVLKFTFSALSLPGSEVVELVGGLTKFGMASNKHRPGSRPLSDLAKQLHKKLARQITELSEFERHVNDGEKTQAHECVTLVLSQSTSDFAALERSDFDPRKLAAELEPRLSVACRERQLSEDGHTYARRILLTVSAQTISLTRDAPRFSDELALKTFLIAKNSQARVRDALNEVILPHNREGTSEEAARFEAMRLILRWGRSGVR